VARSGLMIQNDGYGETNCGSELVGTSAVAGCDATAVFELANRVSTMWQDLESVLKYGIDIL